jgi:hypothetical protein
VRLILTALLLGALVPAALGATGPHVRLVAFSPASVSGTGFHPRERVAVRVTGRSNELARTVVTSAHGAFVARFSKGLSPVACGQLVIVAVGAKGDRAAWKSPLQPCGPPPQPVDQ